MGDSHFKKTPSVADANTTPSIIELAATIQSTAQLIDKHISSNGLASLSFAPNANMAFPTSPPNITHARGALIEACSDLLALVEAPEDYMWHSIRGHYSLAVMQYINHFRLASILPADGSAMSYAEVASKAGVDESRCTRLLRYAIANRVFCEPTMGFVANNANSMWLVQPGVAPTMEYLLEEGGPAAAAMAETEERYSGSEEKNQAPWNVAHRVDKPIFEFFEGEPRRMKRFIDGMMVLGSIPGYEDKYVIEGFDWASLGEGTVVDLAGSNGHVSRALSAAFPSLKFIVQDLEKVVTEAEVRSGGVKNDQIQFLAHDMFAPQPVQGADIYFMRFILHDYPDKYAAKILQNLIPAMGPKSRLVLCDGFAPPAGALPKRVEQKIRHMDLEMMLNYNSAERDQEMWEALFKRADHRLKIRNVVTPPGGLTSFIELVLE